MTLLRLKEVGMLAMDSFWKGFFLILIWVPLIMLWAMTCMDLFQRDMNGWLVALWLLVIFVLPFLGVVCYWIFRPMTLTAKDKERQQAAMEDYETIRAAQETDQLFKLQQLKEKGVLTDEQFEAKKAKILKD
jgi:uncharacterized membrane protein YcjF (UPF0283 family)